MKRFSSADARPAGTGPEAPEGRSARVDRPRAGSAVEDTDVTLDQVGEEFGEEFLRFLQDGGIGRRGRGPAQPPKTGATALTSCWPPRTAKSRAVMPRAMLVWSLLAHSFGIRLPLSRPSSVRARNGMNSEPRTP